MVLLATLLPGNLCGAIPIEYRIASIPDGADLMVVLMSFSGKSPLDQKADQ